MALWSGTFLVLDCHDRLLIWSGRKVAGSAFDSLREACESYVAPFCAARYPTPSVLQVKEGGSMARHLLSRVAPSHKASAWNSREASTSTPPDSLSFHAPLDPSFPDLPFSRLP